MDSVGLRHTNCSRRATMGKCVRACVRACVRGTKRFEIDLAATQTNLIERLWCLAVGACVQCNGRYHDLTMVGVNTSVSVIMHYPCADEFPAPTCWHVDEQTSRQTKQRVAERWFP